MEYFVAETYAAMKRVGEPFEKNGRLYTEVEGVCDRCHGTGIYVWGAIVNGNPQHAGTCFKCNGSGKEYKEVRLYTLKERESMDKANAQRRAKAEEERIQRAAERKAKAFSRWLEWNGFDENGETYLIFGNTYPIKDELKAAGCKFSKNLLWHGPAAVDVPEDCFVEKIKWDRVYNWNEETGEMWPTEEGQTFLDEVFSRNTEGTYVGEIGERLRNLPVIFKKKVEVDGSWGTFNVYEFDFDGAQLRWSTECEKDLQEGEEYVLSGTVKKHIVSRNTKVTYLNRCLIK